jgi:hypothetical protein
VNVRKGRKADSAASTRHPEEGRVAQEQRPDGKTAYAMRTAPIEVTALVASVIDLEMQLRHSGASTGLTSVSTKSRKRSERNAFSCRSFTKRLTRIRYQGSPMI